MADEIIRALAYENSLRVLVAVTTDVSREGARRHGLVAGASVALSRASTAGLLLATLTKGGERVTLHVTGNGPLGQVTVDADDAGNVRAYLQRGSELVAGGPERVSLAKAMGRQGVVSVIRDLGLKERYSGQSRIVTGEIDEDIEHYLRTSEQISSALGCEAVLADNNAIRVAGGVLVQCMPGGVSDPIVREVQHKLRTGELYRHLAQDGHADPIDVARVLLATDDIDILDRRPVQFHCSCSRERVTSMLATLGAEDLAEMQEEGSAEIVCEFCGEKYRVSGGELGKIRKHAVDRPKA